MKKVLIVERDLEVRNAYRVFLRDDFDVLPAASLQEFDTLFQQCGGVVDAIVWSSGRLDDGLSMDKIKEVRAAGYTGLMLVCSAVYRDMQSQAGGANTLSCDKRHVPETLRTQLKP